MKNKSFEFDLKTCRTQLEQFRQFLDQNQKLEERNQVLKKFEEWDHLSASIASFHPKASRFNRLALEYDINGYFKADLVVGDSENNAYCFVEFENAAPNSLFIKYDKEGNLKPSQKKEREIPYWGDRFYKGFSQLIDWLWALDESASDRKFLDRFGTNFISYRGILVIGRDQYLDDQEKRRLEWFQENMIVNSKNIICITFDQLHRDLQDRLNLYQPDEEVVNTDQNGLPTDPNNPPTQF